MFPYQLVIGGNLLVLVTLATSGSLSVLVIGGTRLILVALVTRGSLSVLDDSGH